MVNSYMGLSSRMDYKYRYFDTGRLGYLEADV